MLGWRKNCVLSDTMHQANYLTLRKIIPLATASSPILWSFYLQCAYIAIKVDQKMKTWHVACNRLVI